MALKKIETIAVFGRTLTFDDAYVKVMSVNGNKQSVEVKYSIYNQNGGDFLRSDSSIFVPSMDGANFIKQAYEHLKTLDTFSTARDC